MSTSNTDVQIYQIGCDRGTHEPVITNTHSTFVSDSHEAFRTIEEFCDAERPVWNEILQIRPNRVTKIDVDAKMGKHSFFVFLLNDNTHCKFHSEPFIEPTLAGGPSGLVKNPKLVGSSGRWASFELTPSLDPKFQRIPIIFNFIDEETGISPFYLKSHHLRNHGGIHPPTAASNINLF